MTYESEIHNIDYYQRRDLKVLTNEEQNIFINAEKVRTLVTLDKRDLEFIQKHGLNISRITFFIIKKWIAKKREDWNLHD